MRLISQLLCTGQLPNTGLLREMSPESVDTFTGLAHVLPTMQLGVLPASVEGSVCDTSAPSVLFEQETVSSVIAISSDGGMSKEPSERPSPSQGNWPLPPSPQLGPTADGLVHAVEERLSLENSYEYETETDEEEEYDSEGDDAAMDETTPYPHIFVIGDAANAFGAIKAGHTASFQADVAAANILGLIEFEGKLDIEEEEERGERVQLQHYVPGLPQIKVSLGLVSPLLRACCVAD